MIPKQIFKLKEIGTKGFDAGWVQFEMLKGKSDL